VAVVVWWWDGRGEVGGMYSGIEETLAALRLGPSRPFLLGGVIEEGEVVFVGCGEG
jgi:hypothetical protein